MVLVADVDFVFCVVGLIVDIVCPAFVVLLDVSSVVGVMGDAVGCTAGVGLCDADVVLVFVVVGDVISTLLVLASLTVTVVCVGVDLTVVEVGWVEIIASVVDTLVTWSAAAISCLQVQQQPFQLPW